MPKAFLIFMWFIILGVVVWLSRGVAFSVGAERFDSVSIRNILDLVSLLWTAAMFFHLMEYWLVTKGLHIFTNSRFSKICNATRIIFLFAATVIFSKSRGGDVEFFQLANLLNPVIYAVTIVEIFKSNVFFYSAYFGMFIGVALLPYVDMYVGDEYHEPEPHEVLSRRFIAILMMLAFMLFAIGLFIDIS